MTVIVTKQHRKVKRETKQNVQELRIDNLQLSRWSRFVFVGIVEEWKYFVFTILRFMTIISTVSNNKETLNTAIHSWKILKSS